MPMPPEERHQPDEEAERDDRVEAEERSQAEPSDQRRPQARRRKHEVARAERIVAAFKEAEARGAAAIQVDGQMVDYPVVYRAQALLDAMRDAPRGTGKT